MRKLTAYHENNCTTAEITILFFLLEMEFVIVFVNLCPVFIRLQMPSFPFMPKLILRP